MEIKPIKIWKDTAKYIEATLTDNLKDTCTFNYSLIAERTQLDPEGNEHTIRFPVVSDSLVINNGEYEDWDNSNEQIYEILCKKLGLELI